MSTIDTDYQRCPTCPHCGYAHASWWDGHLARELLCDGDSSIAECPACGREYHVVIEIEYSFSSEAMEEQE